MRSNVTFSEQPNFLVFYYIFIYPTKSRLHTFLYICSNSKMFFLINRFRILFVILLPSSSPPRSNPLGLILAFWKVKYLKIPLSHLMATILYIIVFQARVCISVEMGYTVHKIIISPFIEILLPSPPIRARVCAHTHTHTHTQPLRMVYTWVAIILLGDSVSLA